MWFRPTEAEIADADLRGVRGDRGSQLHAGNGADPDVTPVDVQISGRPHQGAAQAGTNVHGPCHRRGKIRKRVAEIAAQILPERAQVGRLQPDLARERIEFPGRDRAPEVQSRNIG